MNPPRIAVVGSVNLDFVATAAKLPAPGETVTGATLARHPGGKGANQALAARRLGADVKMVARVGRDAMADEALALLCADGVDLTAVGVDDAAATGVALIAVSADGENQIVVASGANARLLPAHLPSLAVDAVICQLEVPMETVVAAGVMPGFFCVNLAPSAPTPDAVFARADLVIVNEGEAADQGAALAKTRGLVAITEGAKGARLLKGGGEIARAAPPRVKVVDTTGAGDAFVGALVVALVEGQAPEAALRFACAAGALAATKAGAQPSLPWREEVERLLAVG
jgi:ribokinase